METTLRQGLKNLRSLQSHHQPRQRTTGGPPPARLPRNLNQSCQCQLPALVSQLLVMRLYDASDEGLSPEEVKQAAPKHLAHPG